MKPKNRIYCEYFNPQQSQFVVQDETFHYLAKVLRAKIGDKIGVFNGKDAEYLCEVADVQKKSLTLNARQKIRDFQAQPPIHLAFAIIKKTPMEFLVQKATELGVRSLTPIVTDYTQGKDCNTERLRSVIIEAAEQCRLTALPDLEKTQSLQSWVESIPGDQAVIFCDEAGYEKTQPIDLALQTVKNDYNGWHIVIGPEGGFSPIEQEFLRKWQNVISVSLGPRIMRAETAALAAVSLCQTQVGDWV